MLDMDVHACKHHQMKDMMSLLLLIDDDIAVVSCVQMLLIVLCLSLFNFFVCVCVTAKEVDALQCYAWSLL